MKYFIIIKLTKLRGREYLVLARMKRNILTYHSWDINQYKFSRK